MGSALLWIGLFGCPKGQPDAATEVQVGPTAPIAEARAHAHVKHGVSRDDPYHWMRNRDDAALLPYVEAENAYTVRMTAHTEALRTSLFDEMLARIQEDDVSVPVEDGGFAYTVRTEQGKAYAIHCRKPLTADAAEQIVVDENVYAEGQDYFDLIGLTISPDHTRVAYGIDTTGRELYTVFVEDIATHTRLADQIPGVTGDLAWANDGKTLFYTVPDDTLRPYAVKRHVIGTDPAADVVVHEETDPKFRVSVSRTRSDAFVVIDIRSSLTSEVRVVSAAAPDGPLQVLSPRHEGHDYHVDHQGDRWLVVTNDCDDALGKHADCALNFALKAAPSVGGDRKTWTTLIAHSDEVTIEDVTAFADHFVVDERANGFGRLRVVERATNAAHVVEMPEAAYVVWSMAGPNYQTRTLRFGYMSMVTPRSVFDYDMVGKTRQLLDQVEVLGGYDPAAYVTERAMATAPDGTAVPLSIVRRADLGDGPHPTWLTGYGAYGISMEPWFSSSRLSLLDRGVVVVIAHVRGGSENGRAWYEHGKFLEKRNTFTDFIAAAEHLVANGTTAPDRLVIQGGSAGGLLIGAVVNLRPDLFKAAIADVPFVDVVTTMLDASIPLTTDEWEEWGDPRQREFFDYMLGYSPYDNVAAKAYPALLVTSGMNDPRVQYWEPTKWVARLRARKTDQNLLLLKTHMGAGHGGESGRYGALRDVAFSYAFALDQLSATGTVPVAVP